MSHPGKRVAEEPLNLDIAILKALVHRAVSEQADRPGPDNGGEEVQSELSRQDFEPEEYRRLLEKCSNHLKPIVQLAYSTAMRCGEILAFRWEQVDFKNRVIYLEAEDTKTQEKREVPLTGELLDLFKQIPRTLGSPHVFTWKGETMGSIKTAFKKACRHAGILDFRFHDLRHCAVTNLRKAGVSDSVIMSISGHKSTPCFSKYDRVDRGSTARVPFRRLKFC